MKKEYNLKDKVWLHLGEPNLVEGRVVDIFDLAHMGYPADREFYVIEIKTGIDNIFEVRDFDQLSPDAKGPIGLFRNLDMKQIRENGRYLGKVGMKLPVQQPNPLVEVVKEINQDLEIYPDEGDAGDPTPEQIHAAMERAEKALDPIFTSHTKPAPKRPAKKRTFVKRKKNDNSSNNS
jgi:hypothetical protein